MKRTIIIIIIILIFGLITPVFAQDRQRDRLLPNFPRLKTVIISGNLIVAHSRPAIIEDNITYLITGINRLVGFVDGLKEGAYVTIEGYAVTSPRDDRLKLLLSSRLIFDGKSYDLGFPGEDFFPDLQLPEGWRWPDWNRERRRNPPSPRPQDPDAPQIL